MTSERRDRSGPLRGLQVLEFASRGPGPFCGMLLADLGADVIRVERPSALPASAAAVRADVKNRGKRSLVLDLKLNAGVKTAMRLVERSDFVIEGWRPGVAERLRLGPDECLTSNPRLIFGRMTGWGQDGPLAGQAGHDLNYIAMSGALSMFGPADRPPTFPVNLLGDYGGGGLLLAFGLLAALAERTHSGIGQVVDASMLDGVTLFTATVHGWRAIGDWDRPRGLNHLDGGAPYYNVYECQDGRHLSVGAIEPKFFGNFLDSLDINSDDPLQRAQESPEAWPSLTARLRELFRTRTRSEWCELFAGADACVAPVLSLSESASHEQHVQRGTFIDVGGVVQPGPAPRFSASVRTPPDPPPHPGCHSRAVLREAGLDDEWIDGLIRDGVTFEQPDQTTVSSISFNDQ